MLMRTPRRYLQSRLTPEMEKKLNFFTSYVRFGAHKRYQDWFLKQVSAPVILLILTLPFRYK